jgi:hypothetical protein
VKLFEIAVLRHPRNDEGKRIGKTELVVGVTTVLANDLAQAQMLSGREIPEELLDKIEELEVVVRPF